jgi:hypothetical protein
MRTESEREGEREASRPPLRDQAKREAFATARGKGKEPIKWPASERAAEKEGKEPSSRSGSPERASTIKKEARAMREKRESEAIARLMRKTIGQTEREARASCSS